MAAVFDFVHLHIGSFSWYVFNVADAAIVAGVVGLVYDAFVADRTATASGLTSGSRPSHAYRIRHTKARIGADGERWERGIWNDEQDLVDAPRTGLRSRAPGASTAAVTGPGRRGDQEPARQYGDRPEGQGPDPVSRDGRRWSCRRRPSFGRRPHRRVTRRQIRNGRTIRTSRRSAGLRMTPAGPATASETRRMSDNNPRLSPAEMQSGSDRQERSAGPEDAIAATMPGT